MTRRRTARLLSTLALALASLSAPSAFAQMSTATVQPSKSTWPPLTLSAESGPRRFVAQQQGTFNGKKLRYSATLEETILKDRNGKAASSIFTTAFVSSDGGTAKTRPVMFIFNGGPGGASNGLMFGAFGPKRLTKFDSAAQADPNIAYADNPFSPLDAADLVFIDAPETGFGRPLADADPKTFRSNDGDSFAFGQFILHWLSTNNRLDSPIYIAGESYGSLRAVMLARDLLAATPSVKVSGLIMISQAITYNGPASFGLKRLPDPMRAITRLHDATALAWHHGLIDNKGQTLEQAIAAAKAFEQTDYASALIRGNRLSEGERNAIAQQLQQHTGLPASYFLAHNLRVENVRRDLLASKGLALGQFDGRETEDAKAVVPDEDRDWDKATLGLTTAMQRYSSEVLKAKGLPAYRSIVPDPYGFEKTWGYIAPPNPALDVVLEEQLRANPALRILVPQGVFDTTSSMGETEALFSRLNVAKDRFAITYYPGGHMLYSDLDGLKAFNTDVRGFLAGANLNDRPFPTAKSGVPQ